MRGIVLGVALVAFGAAQPVAALTLACENGKPSADFAATSVVAKTETGKDCYVSVDGAAAAPALAGPALAMARCMQRFHNLPGKYSAYAPVFGGYVVPLLAAASAPRFSGDAAQLPVAPAGDEAACEDFLDRFWTERKLYAAFAPFQPLVEEITTCLATPRDAKGAHVVCERPEGALVMRFTTDLGVHTLRLPYP